MEQITNLEEADAAFRARGATHYHDSEFPAQGQARYPELGRLFARYYFKGEDEIGYVLPYMLRHGQGVVLLEAPRVWGFEKNLIPLA